MKIAEIEMIGGIDTVVEKYPAYDSLFGVSRHGVARPVNHNRAILLHTQGLPPVLEDNSRPYMSTGDVPELRHNRIGHRPFLFKIDRFTASDIDEVLNLRHAEVQHREHENPK